jgi:hypothetical protein
LLRARLKVEKLQHIHARTVVANLKMRPTYTLCKTSCFRKSLYLDIIPFFCDLPFFYFDLQLVTMEIKKSILIAQPRSPLFRRKRRPALRAESSTPHWDRYRISAACFVLGCLFFCVESYKKSRLLDYLDDIDIIALPKTTVGYAVTVTDCKPSDTEFFDGAAVLKHSIHLASLNSKYNYRMYAFVHPDARECSPYLSKLGYEVQIRETPVQVSDINNTQLQRATRSGCCGAKEFMKLYSYLLDQHPIVVHLDLDTLVLKPLDNIIDYMLEPSFNYSNIPVMWMNKPDELPATSQQVDFLFTRDYNMVDPPRRKPHQIQSVDAASWPILCLWSNGPFSYGGACGVSVSSFASFSVDPWFQKRNLRPVGRTVIIIVIMLLC